MTDDQIMAVHSMRFFNERGVMEKEASEPLP